jgi:BASS family bile acid:Na+ symporter
MSETWFDPIILIRLTYDIMNLETIFKIIVFIATVTLLGSMGLENKLKDSLEALRNIRFVALILIWGWVVGPALAYLITRILPLSEGHAAGLLLISLAPAAPFYPVVVRRARGDTAYAAGFILLATVGTVVLLPIMAPLIIKGLIVTAWALTKPLLITVLLPLIVGLAIKVYKEKLADKLFPIFKKTGNIFILIVVALTFVIYWREMVDALGSFAIGALLLFFIVLAVLSYKIGLGLKQQQRSVMSLGMCTRNIAGVFVAYFGIVNPDPGIFVMVVLVMPVTIIVALIASRSFSKRAG